MTEQDKYSVTFRLSDGLAKPPVVDRATFQAQLDELRVREKAHTRQGDAIAAARRRLPMVEVGSATPLIGADGETTLLEAFEGRRMLIAYYFMWNTGAVAADQCEGCSFYTSQVRELSFVHSPDVTYATFCQGPFAESIKYRDFMGWDLPWYSAEQSLDTLLVGRRIGMMHLVCYLRDQERVYETYWTTIRGSRPWTITIGCWTSPSTGARNRGKTHPPDGRSSGVSSVISMRTASMDVL